MPKNSHTHTPSYMLPTDKPKNSPLVKGKKYRQLKANNATLTKRNCELASELIHIRQQIHNLENLLATKNTELAQFQENPNNLEEQEQIEQDSTSSQPSQIDERKLKFFLLSEARQKLIEQLQQQLNSARQERDNYREQFQNQQVQNDDIHQQLIQVQQEKDNQQNRAQTAEQEVQALKDQLATELKNTYRSQRSQRTPQ